MFVLPINTKFISSNLSWVSSTLSDVSSNLSSVSSNLSDVSSTVTAVISNLSDVSSSLASSASGGSWEQGYSGTVTLTVGATATNITSIIGGLTASTRGNALVFYDSINARFLCDPSTTAFYKFYIAWRLSGTITGGGGTTSEYEFYLTRGDGVTLLPVRKTVARPGGAATTYTTENIFVLEPRVFAGGADNFQLTGPTGGFMVWVRKTAGNDMNISGTQTFLFNR